MRFSTDHYFQIGHAHYMAGKPCQDHALSRSNGLIACAIVSDGCSTGGNTDVGSRMVTFGTLQAIRDHAKASNGSLEDASILISARQQQLTLAVQPMLGLEWNDMLATCVYAYLTQNGALIFVQGDGVVAWKYRDGSIRMHRFDWAKNAPFYPSYGEEGAGEYLLKLHGGAMDTALMSHASLSQNQNGSFEQEQITQIPFDEGRKGISLELSPEDLRSIEFIAVFTDGVGQVGNLPNGDESLGWQSVVSGFLSFKSTAGEFAKRRMIRGIKDIQKIGKGPIDDIAYAVIHIQPDDPEKENAV